MEFNKYIVTILMQSNTYMEQQKIINSVDNFEDESKRGGREKGFIFLGTRLAIKLNNNVASTLWQTKDGAKT